MAVTPTTERARRQRSNATACERRLWDAIKHRRLGGLKFTREFEISGYTVDFACVAARLVVEVDGPSHDQDEQQTFDFWRTKDLERSGWSVIRVTNLEVLQDLPRVLATIEREARPNG